MGGVGDFSDVNRKSFGLSSETKGESATEQDTDRERRRNRGAGRAKARN